MPQSKWRHCKMHDQTLHKLHWQTSLLLHYKAQCTKSAPCIFLIMKPLYIIKISLLFLLHFVRAIWKIDISQQNDKFQGDLIPRFSDFHVRMQNRRWPNGQIPYVIMPGYTHDEVRLIENAMNRINHLTCIRFYPRTNQNDYIYIENTPDGCYTTGIGRLGGAQKISLQAGPNASCMFHDIIIHELMHVVGLGHEHNRLDRDHYVKINLQNVMMGAVQQFFKYSPYFGADLASIPYDYLSIMHYNAHAFSKDGFSPTIEPLDVRFFRQIGNVLDMSYHDILKVAKIYNCPGINKASFCHDRSPHCPKFRLQCRTWTVMRFHCQRTCGFCNVSA